MGRSGDRHRGAQLGWDMAPWPRQQVTQGVSILGTCFFLWNGALFTWIQENQTHMWIGPQEPGSPHLLCNSPLHNHTLLQSSSPEAGIAAQLCILCQLSRASCVGECFLPCASCYIIAKFYSWKPEICLVDLFLCLVVVCICVLLLLLLFYHLCLISNWFGWSRPDWPVGSMSVSGLTLAITSNS